MFTGIVEEIGEILELKHYSHGLQARIKAKKVLEDIQLGDSIAVNGICLTATEFSMEDFVVDIMSETIKRTTWQYIGIGSKVHLERALQLQSRLGGHYVTGHIDNIGRIRSLQEQPRNTLVEIVTEPKLLKYMVPQGSITVDGVSLTLVDVKNDSFIVSLIPHTTIVTTLLTKGVNSLVNLEVDIMAKYVEKCLGGYIPRANKAEQDNLSVNFLQEHGF